MTAKKKRQQKSTTDTTVRLVQCEYCKKKHNVMDSGWVYNGNHVILCHNGVTDDCCFTKHRKDREMESGESSR
jgi:hypothetical protein